MKKKILMICLLFLIIPCLFLFTGCGKTNQTTNHTHTYSSDFLYDAQYHWKKCDGCSKTINKSYHQYSDWEETKKATSTSNGNKQRTCIICGYKETQEIYYSDVSYTINFNLNGGTTTSSTAPIQITSLDSSKFFFDVTKDGYGFRGWQCDGIKVFNEKGEIINNINLKKEMTFVAIYDTTAVLTITSNMPEAGEISKSGYYQYNSNVTVSAVPYQGYKFIGWHINVDGTKVLLSNQQEYNAKIWDQDYELIAIFELDYFKLNISSNNSTLGDVIINPSQLKNYRTSDSENIQYTKSVVISANTKTDARFLGWFDSNNVLVVTNAVYIFNMPNYDYKLTAKWDKFNITYNLNGGTLSNANPSYYTSTDEITLNIPKRSGYEFVGWKCDGEIITKINTKLYKDLTINAVWSQIYSVSYVLNGGTNNTSNPKNYTYESDTITLLGPTRNYYTFAGWYTNSDFTGSKITQITKGTTGNKTLYAKWNPINFNISYDLNGGRATNPTTYNVETNTFMLSYPTKTGYTFIGWTGSNGETKQTSVSITKGTHGNLTYTAHWELTTYNITYYLNGGTNNTSNPKNYTYESDTITLLGPTLHNCTFEGWYTNSDFTGSKVSQITKGSIGGITLYAKWIIPENLKDFEFCENNTGLTITGTKEEKSIYIIPNSVTSIGDYAFSYCTSLTSIIIPNSVTSIGIGAFERCDSLTSITIPDSVTSIGDYAFRNCTGLTSITIPDSVTSIGTYAFSYCRSLEYNKYNNAYYLGNTLNPYLVLIKPINTSITDCQIHSDCKFIYESAFNNCTSLTSITIPDSVTSIGDYAFEYCTRLTNITIPNSLISIGYRAFNSCYSLTIYCKSSSKPGGWSSSWNYSNRPVYWYSETQPTTSGNFWHYVNGIVTKW